MADGVSPQLAREASSALPPWASTPLILILIAVIVARLLLVSRRPLDQHITSILVWWLGAVILREPWIQHQLMDAGIRLGDIRLATHGFVLAGAVSIYLVVRAWDSHPVSRRTVLALYGGVLALLLVLAWLSAPARESGIAVEELRSWRTAAYMVLYSLPMPLALTAVMGAFVDVARRPDTTRFHRVIAVVSLGCVLVSFFDHLSRLVNGLMLAAQWQNAFTQFRSESNDVLFLPAATVLALVVAAPLVQAVRVRLRHDPASMAVRRLEALWTDLVAAMPKHSLEATSLLPNSIEREHRMRIECEDAIYDLLPYMPTDVLQGSPDPAELCDAIALALDRHHHGGSPTTEVFSPPWLTDETELLRIADAWTKRPAPALAYD